MSTNKEHVKSTKWILGFFIPIGISYYISIQMPIIFNIAPQSINLQGLIHFFYPFMTFLGTPTKLPYPVSISLPVFRRSLGSPPSYHREKGR